MSEESKTKYLLVKELLDSNAAYFVPLRDLIFHAHVKDGKMTCIDGVKFGAYVYYVVMDMHTRNVSLIEDFRVKTPDELIIRLELNGLVYE